MFKYTNFNHYLLLILLTNIIVHLRNLKILVIIINKPNQPINNQNDYNLLFS